MVLAKQGRPTPFRAREGRGRFFTKEGGGMEGAALRASSRAQEGMGREAAHPSAQKTCFL